ncbi:MAG: phosphotransferase, partial [Firmicutes bacterium]|nr:phosphotransferase [Bacillota bacterium]
MGIQAGSTSETLRKVLRKALGQEVLAVSYKADQLQGGSVGEVMLVSGTARTLAGRDLPFNVVYKRQKQWERYGDPHSWRREYDLYGEQLDTVFSDSFRWPQCYHAELIGDETHIWMEYLEGVSGLELTGATLEHIAEELGRWQGRLYAQQPVLLSKLSNLSSKDYIKNYYLHYRSWKEVYDYIRSADCEIPKHLCDMLIDLDERSDEIWETIEQLPVVLCHRDFWVANIFYSDQKVRVIDWDTAG